MQYRCHTITSYDKPLSTHLYTVDYCFFKFWIISYPVSYTHLDVYKRQPHLQYAVIVSDIDNFKLINDTYGHLAGDDIILSIAQHLQTTFRNQDIIGRFGGDEFIIFVNDIPSISWLCEKIQSLLICSVTTEIACSNSIGIAMYPQDANNLETLIQYADTVSYTHLNVTI